jgi:hypothetical protein
MTSFMFSARNVSKFALLIACVACGDDSTSVPRKLNGVWTGALDSDSGPDSVRVVVAQYSDFLRGDAVFAAATSPRFAVVGSFIDNGVELDFIRLPAFSPDARPEFLFRGAMTSGRISGQLTAGREGSIVLVPWRPNVAGVPGTWVLTTVNGAPTSTVSDTLTFQPSAQLTRARYTSSFSYKIPGIYERKGSSVVVRYLAPFFDFSIPQRDSLVLRGSALVRVTSIGTTTVEEAYSRTP